MAGYRDKAKKLFPKLVAGRLGTVATDDGVDVFLTCYDQGVVLVLHNDTDLRRVKGMIDEALLVRAHRKAAARVKRDNRKGEK